MYNFYVGYQYKVWENKETYFGRSTVSLGDRIPNWKDIKNIEEILEDNIEKETKMSVTCIVILSLIPLRNDEYTSKM